MSNEQYFIDGIREDPHDDHARLVYADWLEEDEEDVRASLIRLQIELEKDPWGKGAREQKKAIDALLAEHRMAISEQYVKLFDITNAPIQQIICDASTQFRRGLPACFTLSSFDIEYFDPDVFNDLPVEGIHVKPINPERNHGTVNTIGGKFPDIRELNMSESRYVIDSTIRDIAYLANLRTLQLNSTNISDRGIAEQLSQIQTLEKLDVRACYNITGEGMIYVKDLPHLFALNVANTCVNDTGLEHLADVNTLEDLCLDNTGITDKGLATISGLTGMRRLHLKDTDITQDGLKSLQYFSRLQELTLGGCEHEHTEEISLIGCGDFLSLEILRVSGSSIGDEDIAYLSNAPITHLDLDSTEVTDACIEHLPSSISFLDIGRTDITDTGLTALTKLDKLHTLIIMYADVTKKGVLALAALSNLQELVLDSQCFSPNDKKDFEAELVKKGRELDSVRITISW